MLAERAADFAMKFKNAVLHDLAGASFTEAQPHKTDGECAAIIINLKRGALRDLIKYIENFTANLKRSLAELIWQIEMRLASAKAVNLLRGCS